LASLESQPTYGWRACGDGFWGWRWWMRQRELWQNENVKFRAGTKKRDKQRQLAGQEVSTLPATPGLRSMVPTDFQWWWLEEG